MDGAAVLLKVDVSGVVLADGAEIHLVEVSVKVPVITVTQDMVGIKT